MRITFIGQANKGLATNKIGGSEICYRRLGMALGRLGHEVDYVIYGQKIAKPNFLVREGDSTFCSNFEELSNKIEHIHSDLINVGPMSIRGKLWKSILKLKARGSKISTIYWMYPVFSDRLSIKIRSLIFHFMVFDVIFGSSPRIVASLRRNYLKSYLLPPPISSEFYSNNRKLPMGPYKIKNIGYIGRIGKDKGIEWFLKQNIGFIQKKGYDLKIYGYWDEYDGASIALHRLLRRKIGKNYIHYPISKNIYSSNYVCEWLDNIHLLILPYVTLMGTVDIPLILLEACAKGCKVAVTDVGDLKKLFSSITIMMSLEEDIMDIIKKAEKYSGGILSDIYKSDNVATRFINYSLRQ